MYIIYFENVITVCKWFKLISKPNTYTAKWESTCWIDFYGLHSLKKHLPSTLDSLDTFLLKESYIKNLLIHVIKIKVNNWASKACRSFVYVTSRYCICFNLGSIKPFQLNSPAMHSFMWRTESISNRRVNSQGKDLMQIVPDVSVIGMWLVIHFILRSMKESINNDSKKENRFICI